MKKALLIAPTAKFHTLFNINNILVLKELGYTVDVCANFYNDYKESIRNQNIIQQLSLYEVGVINAPFVRKSFIKNIAVIKQLKKIVKSHRYDLIHVHTETGGFLFLISILFQKKRALYVYTPHGTSFYKGSSLISKIVYKPIEKKIAMKMDANLSMNDEEKTFFDKCRLISSKYVHGIGLDMQKIIKIKPYTRKEISDYFGIDEYAVLLLSVGELCSRKNHSIVIDALSKINDLNIKYMICGTGDLRHKLEKKAKKLGIENNVFFADYRTDVLSIVAACDIFVFPSIYEGLPVSVMEAMALKKPVICSSIRGNRDLIDHNKGGYLVSNNDVNQYVSFITMLAKDKKCRQLFGDYNYSKVQLFSDGKVRNELKTIYSSLEHK